TTADYKKIAPSLPKQPGVYQYIDKQGNVLYVGKAKNLKNRIRSYFTKDKNKAFRTRAMIKNADHVIFTIVHTEHDALILENTLIKKIQPRYNVLLKDGKGYSYICIKNERFPRVFIARRIIKDGSTYFGPYTAKHRINQIVDLIKNLFQLRTCSYALTSNNIAENKFKVCLQYHIKNCQGACEGMESVEQYDQKIDLIKNILKGNFTLVKTYIKEQMHLCAEDLQFEKAQIWKAKLDLFEDYHSKSTVASQSIKDVDVFSYAENEEYAFINFLKVVNGIVLNAYSVELKKNLNQNIKGLLRYAIMEIRTKFNSIAPEIILPVKIKYPDDSVTTITVPQRGDKKKLLELSQKNSMYMMMQHDRDKRSRTAKKTSVERILTTLQEDLQMDKLPLHIECFDNSNIQGTHPVASCVVFRNAKPAKRDYRHFHIKTVVGANDFASMEEIVYRRYKRLLDEKIDLPQLVIIDGGKGQLSSAVKSLDVLGIRDRVCIIGIAKRLEEIYFPDDPVPLYINKKSESLKLIQQARNEAHRFAIEFHRNIRSKSFIHSALLDVPGIGEKTAEKLLKELKSVDSIKKSSEADLIKVVGKKNAANIRSFFGL
ncbi:UNVERIFIED_CONTAM: hypothetical protein GTU68_039226, partial [Idotea baltica]|nr:hypothetical protein [Idotea baltica]